MGAFNGFFYQRIYMEFVYDHNTFVLLRIGEAVNIEERAILIEHHIVVFIESV